jgi:hypothetical protein
MREPAWLHMAGITTHDERISNWIVAQGAKGVHCPGMITIVACHRNPLGIDSIGTGVVIRIETTPGERLEVKEQGAVTPIFTVRIAAEDDNLTATRIKGTTSVGLSLKDDAIAVPLLMDLNPPANWQFKKILIKFSFARPWVTGHTLDKTWHNERYSYQHEPSRKSIHDGCK